MGASLMAQMVKNPFCNPGNLGWIPGLGRCPGEGIDYLLRYSCLENSMDGGAWLATNPEVAKRLTKSNTFTYICYTSIPGLKNGEGNMEK